MNSLRKIICILFALTITSLSHTISASELSDYKAAGVIGEKYDGYLAVVKQAGPEVEALVKDVNEKRKQKYLELSQKHGKSLTEIEKIAGAAAINKTESGHFVMMEGAGWTKKP